MIETERLRLRGHVTADLPAMTLMWKDPDVTRFLNTDPLDEEACWARFLRYAGHWCALGYGYWAVEERSSGTFIGEAGFANYRRQTDPPTDLAPEAGWVLAKQFHGRGYATEIVRALVCWGKDHFGAVPLQCIVHPNHQASLHVARKNGFVAVKTLEYKGSPTVLLELSSSPSNRNTNN